MRLCQTVKIPFEIVKQIFSGKEASYSGKLYSPEHKQDFEAESAKISIARNPKDNKLCLAIGGMYYTDWFREQKKKFLESIGINIQDKNKTNKNIKMR